MADAQAKSEAGLDADSGLTLTNAISSVLADVNIQDLKQEQKDALKSVLKGNDALALLRVIDRLSQASLSLRAANMVNAVTKNMGMKTEN